MARFRMITVFEGLATGDRRFIQPQALTTRALPLSLTTLFDNPDFGGHGGATISGRIDTLERVDAAAMVDEATGEPYGTGVFAWVGEGEFTTDDVGQRTEELVRSRALRGVSVDLTAVESELEVLEEDEDGWPTDWLDTVTAGEIAAATVCATPAFRGCTIEILGDDAEAEPAATDEAAAARDAVALAAAGAPSLPAWRIVNDGPGCEPCTSPAAAGLATAMTAAGGPLHPPTAWFADPGLTEPTPLTVLDDGRVFGHWASWGSCHVGQPGACVTPPHSGTDYSYFHVGALRTAEGGDVAVGHLTIEGPHADLRASTAAGADVRAGEDAHGIWVAGAVRPDVTAEQLRVARSSPLSGDWRRVGTGLEMVAALSVNTPGFVVPRPRALAASGVPVALVAAGAMAQPTLHRPGRHQVDDATRDLLRELQAERRELRAERLLARIRGQR
jgi:hypothetical protein